MNITDRIAVCISNDNETVTAEETINAIIKAGFKNVFVQWYNKDWNPSQQKQLQMVKEAGLNVLFAHLGYQKINTLWDKDPAGDSHIERYKNDLRICKENGIDLVCMHLTEKSSAPEDFEAGIRRLKEITDYAKEIGMRVSFENTKIPGYVDYALANIKDDHVGFCFDSGHYHAHFHDELDFTQFKDRIFAIHLHDNKGEKDEHLNPFDGTLDWNDTLIKLAECGYDGPITLELCYRNEYLNTPLDEFYKEGYGLAEKLVKMFDEIKKGLI